MRSQGAPVSNPEVDRVAPGAQDWLKLQLLCVEMHRVGLGEAFTVLGTAGYLV